jgi:hypothetical protein
MMTFTRFRRLVQAYGADFQRWPERERDEARALLVVSPEAGRLLKEAQIVDAGIEGALAMGRLGANEESAALARLRTGVAQRLKTSGDEPRRPDGFLFWLRNWLGGETTAFPRWAVASGAGAAIVVGLLMGSMYTTSPPPAGTTLFALLEPSPIQIFEN